MGHSHAPCSVSVPVSRLCQRPLDGLRFAFNNGKIGPRSDVGRRSPLFPISNARKCQAISDRKFLLRHVHSSTDRADIYLRRNMDLVALWVSFASRDLAPFFGGLDQSFS